jgi:YD repeat-containing protein
MSALQKRSSYCAADGQSQLKLRSTSCGRVRRRIDGSGLATVLKRFVDAQNRNTCSAEIAGGILNYLDDHSLIPPVSQCDSSVLAFLAAPLVERMRIHRLDMSRFWCILFGTLSFFLSADVRAEFTPYRSSDDVWGVGITMGGAGPNCSVSASTAHHEPYTAAEEPFTEILNAECNSSKDRDYWYDFNSCGAIEFNYNDGSPTQIVSASYPCAWNKHERIRATGQVFTSPLNVHIGKSCFMDKFAVDTSLTYEPGSTWCRCFNPGFLFIPSQFPYAYCLPPKERLTSEQPKTCSADTPGFGDPIFPTLGANKQKVSLGINIGGAEMTVQYDTDLKLPRTGAEVAWLAHDPPSFGFMWNGNLHREIRVNSSDQKILLVARGGTWASFDLNTSNDLYIAKGKDPDYIKRGKDIYSFEYYDMDAKAIEYYRNATLAIVPWKIYYFDGRVLDLQYSDFDTPKDIAPDPGLLIKVFDQFSRTLEFHYEKSSVLAVYSRPRLKEIIGSNGEKTEFEYNDKGYLSKIIWPDQKTRTFFYEIPSLEWALTAVFDELQQKHVSFLYEPDGRAKGVSQVDGQSEHYVDYGTIKPAWSVIETLELDPNGRFLALWRDHYRVNPDQITVTDPLRSVSGLSTQLKAGRPRLTGQTQPAGSGCIVSSNSITYDVQANATSKVDFSARRSCHAYDLRRNLETVRVEGLLSADACPADLASYVVPSTLAPDKPRRKISTQWHPAWRLETRVAEPKLITTSVYNGRTDPVSGQVLRCAPADARLPDGSPIAVLCRRTEQPTTDDTGSAGFAAVLEGDARIWNYTYNRWGQKLSEDGPRTDVADVSTWAYYADTSAVAGAEHTLGDLKSMTNPAGHKTDYLRYDNAGRLLKSRAANGVLTEITYTARGWVDVVSVTPAGSGVAQLTDHDYWPTGLLKKVIQPDGSWTAYTYDSAHRLTDVADNLGNTVHYTLDGMGNRKKEEFKDPGGTLARTIDRVYDALNRLQNYTGAGGTP